MSGENRVTVCHMRVDEADTTGDSPPSGGGVMAAGGSGGAKTDRRGSTLSNVVADLGSGALVAFISAAYSLSFAMLIFSGRLAEGLPAGAAAMIFSAGVATVVAASLSSYRFAIAGPDTATMAVLSAMVLAIAAAMAGSVQEQALMAHVVVAVSMTTLVTGIALLAIGVLKLGVWMRYIPYPVMGGFLAAAGALLVAGAVKVVTGHRIALETLPLLVEGDALRHVLAGVACAAAIMVARRTSKHFLVLPGMLLAEAAAVYMVLAGLGVPLAQARAETWLLAAVEEAGPVSLWSLADFRGLAWSTLLGQSAEIAAAIGVSAVAILLTATGVEIAARTSLDLNRELRVGGLSNLLLGSFGGVLGNLTFNRTMLNHAAGARSRLSGIIAGLLCMALAVAGVGVVSYVPTPVLGGLLFYMGFGLLATWVGSMRRRLSRSDYVLILAIMIVIVTRGYLEGIVLGVIASCIIFALNYSRVRIIKHRLSRQQTSSYVDRSTEEQAFLLKHGARIQILWIQGYLFFGTANGLLEALLDWVAGSARGPERVLIVDFRQVTGIDSSAIFSFLKLRNLVERHRVRLVLSGMSPSIRQPFANEGFLEPGSGTVREYPNLDLALEWAEEELLAAAGAFPPLKHFDSWLQNALGSPAIAARFKSYLELVRLEKGQHLFEQGDPADALFFVRSGRVSVILERAGEPPLRLRTMTGFTVVGEMGLYRDMRRSAAVVADVSAEVYRLSRDNFRRMETEEPAVSSAFHVLIVRILADRLSFASNEIAALLR